MKRSSMLICGLVLLGSARAEAQAFPIPAPVQPAPTPPAPGAAADAPAAASGAAPVTPAPVTPPPAAEPLWMGNVDAPPAAARPALIACTPACAVGSQCSAGRCIPGGAIPACSGGGDCAPYHEPGFRRHDGFMLRSTSGLFSTGVRVGAGSAHVNALKDQTVTGNLSLDVGDAVIDNLIVRGRLDGGIGGAKDSPFGGDVGFVFGAIGAGVDYYFMPINLYVGGTLSLAGLTVAELNNLDRPKDERDNHTRHSKTGVGIDLDVGKEWWVSGNWGLGAALRLRYLDMAPANIGLGRDGRLTSFQAGLQFSATYN